MVSNQYYKFNEVQFLFRQEKLWIVLGAVFFIIAGIFSIFLPFVVLGLVLVFVSLFVILAGIFQLVEGTQRLIKKLIKKKIGLWNFLLNLVRAVLDILLGFLLINYFNFSVDILSSILGFLFVVDGILQIIAGLTADSFKNRMTLFATGIIIVLLGLGAALQLADINLKIIGILIGIKLILYGVSVVITILNNKMRKKLLWRLVTTTNLPKILGGVYAAYFGGGFHTGIYVGNNQIVHFKANGKIIKTSWNEFFANMAPQMWEYPDIKKVPVKKIIEIALSHVNKKLPYRLFKNNCEHFVVYCLSGGKTTISQYSQYVSSLVNIKKRPFLGSFIEFYLRSIEWFIFKYGW